MASKTAPPETDLQFGIELDADEYFVRGDTNRIVLTRSEGEAEDWCLAGHTVERIRVEHADVARPDGIAPPAQMKKFPRAAAAFVAVGTRKDGSEFVPQMPGALDAHKECIENRFLPPLQQTFPEVAWRAEPLFTERPLHMGTVS